MSLATRLIIAVLVWCAFFAAHGAQQDLNLGTGPNTGTGEGLRTAMAKIQNNFDELYATAANVNSLGAVPDDLTDDYAFIVDALNQWDVCVLSPGTYLVSKQVHIGSNQKLIGAGAGLSTLKLMNNSAEYAALAPHPNNKYGVVSSGAGNNSNIVVANMTVDANFDNQALANWTNTMYCVALGGMDLTIDGVKAIGWGIGGQTIGYSECFPLIVDDTYVTTPRTNRNVIRNCEVTTMNTTDGGDGDVSCIAVAAHYGAGELVGNWVHDIPNGLIKPNNMHGTTGYGTNVLVYGNIVENVVGSGFYGDSYTNSNIRVTGNVWHDTRAGVYLNGGQWHGLQITDNHWDNLSLIPSGWDMSRNVEAQIAGDYRTHGGVIIAGGTATTNLLVRANDFLSETWTNAGVQATPTPPFIAWLTADNYDHWKVQDNLLYYRGPTSANYDVNAYGAWWIRDTVSLVVNKIHWSNNRNAYGGAQYLNERGYGSGTTYSSTEETMMVASRFLPAAPPAYHGQVWHNSTNQLPYWLDENGNMRVMATVATNKVCSGSDYSLTATYADVTFATGTDPDLNALPPGIWLIYAAVTYTGGNAGDVAQFQLYNSTDAAAVSGTPTSCTISYASGQQQTLITGLVDITAAKRIRLQARNATAARGTVQSSGTRLHALRLQ